MPSFVTSGQQKYSALVRKTYLIFVRDIIEHLSCCLGLSIILIR